MTPETVLTIGRDALLVGIMLGAPMLITALGVGVLVGIFQAATQINEMTLSFIPKALSLAAVAVLFGPWMLRALMEYTKRLVDSIPGLLY
ncbi:flagellar biosynthesis protein FliQ [Sinimarinibacterium sp. NLF-5-8]|uniref:flagellar biosynthesis protein FliQ n=1 Tax=Sinimarinibacterium sp. NLF-5-8 TaxID=2698684 RepID=UPI00137BE584|nr:flagellar biosynthesis protein FliQ [Sinimarinibacterium sp. NLF-5-8]QHS09251.1 flagellar biosynthesis protein FliQ [Sinimarinibacterium sp. NLF-5-8]